MIPSWPHDTVSFQHRSLRFGFGLRVRLRITWQVWLLLSACDCIGKERHSNTHGHQMSAGPSHSVHSEYQVPSGCREVSTSERACPLVPFHSGSKCSPGGFACLGDEDQGPEAQPSPGHTAQQNENATRQSVKMFFKSAVPSERQADGNRRGTLGKPNGSPQNGLS